MTARLLLSSLCLLGLCLVATAASAETCARPDANAGYLGYAYGDAAAQTFDGAKVRVHYVSSGPHAVVPAADGNGFPPSVQRIAEVGDDALARFAEQGFRVPVADGKAACGDGPLVDIYLVAFGKSDGLTATESCVQKGEAAVCASFVLVDSRLDLRYPTEEQGIRTVVPHELFHVVQNAYDAELSRFWAEGTAQWAAARLDPSLPDLASYVGSFLKEPTRALDGPVNGVTGAYLYGSALWPVFLSLVYGEGIVEEILTEEAGGSTSLQAADTVLQTHGSDLGTAYATFAQWNLSTGKRAAPGGYPDAASYGLVPLRAWPVAADGTSEVSAVMAGLSNHPFAVDAGGEAELAIEADASRVRAFYIPLNEGRAVFTESKPLPTVVPRDGSGIAVVVNATTSKVDSPFKLTRRPRASSGAGGAGSNEAQAGAAGAAVAAIPAPLTEDGGCSFHGTRSVPAPRGLGLTALATLLSAARPRKRLR